MITKHFRKHPRKLALSAILGLLVLGGGAVFMVQGSAHAQHMTSGQHNHGADGTGHDMTNMPGLRGANASAEESAELAVMFNGFESFTRTVENLPNGIRTVTRTSDPVVMEALVNHVAGMTERVFNNNDPKIIIQSPTLDIFFKRGDGILTDMDILDDGIEVVQTSDDPEVVKALQIHAGEVTEMAERGMDAVHEMMMKR
ncbi:MAG: hypothetical protein WBC85_01845 [Planktotalea sp.]